MRGTTIREGEVARDDTGWWQSSVGSSVARRSVLKGLGLSAGTALAEGNLSRSPLMTSLAAVVTEPITELDVLRPEDFLYLRFRFVNLLVDTSLPNQPMLRRRRSDRRALVVVGFPPQHVAEEVLLTTGAQGSPPNPPPPDQLVDPVPPANVGMAARLARRSRLAFEFPDGVQAIPFTMDSLLDWAALTPHLVPVAGDWSYVSTMPQLRRPTDNETAIEAPWWLVLSPSSQQAWAHAAEPVSHNGRTELWHTRLARLDNGVVDEAQPDGVRAVWARDPDFGDYLRGTATPPGIIDQLRSPHISTDGMPMRMAYTPQDRLDAVRNTSDYSAYSPWTIPSGYMPQPFRTERLMLSSLGAWVDIDGNWADSPFNSLVEWRHRATLGRDHYVRIVNKGYLHPFGHRAVLVRETERRFRDDNGTRGAYLLLRAFVVVTQPVREYPASLGLPIGGRSFPFQQLEVVTRVSPGFGGLDTVGDPHAFQPLDVPNGSPIALGFRGTDWEGNTATFNAPFVFVEDVGDAPFDATVMQSVNSAYAALPEVRRRADLAGQPVAFAPPSVPGNTSFPVGELVFGALDAVSNAAGSAFRDADQLRGFPQMRRGLVNLPVVEQLAGVPGLAPSVEYVDQYLQNGFDGLVNAGEAFLRFPQPLPLPFSTENAGGMANPSQQLTAITRNLGPVAGELAHVLADEFHPDKVFSDLAAKILGGIPLKDILNVVSGVAGDAEKAMKYAREQLPDEVVVRFRWKPDLKKDPLHIFEPLSNPKTDAFIEGEARQSVKDPNKRSARFHGEITSFRLHLIGDGPTEFLRISVSKLSFTSATGQKTQIDVAVDDVAFQGALKFVDELRKYLPAIGKGLDSVPIPKAITASMGIAIPAVAVGVFELSNLAFSAAVTVPLTGDPVRVRFAFSSRQDPFLLTISCFGGSGFFAIAIGADGVELLEIQFAFAASLTLDIGVAQGGVDITAGIYLKLAKQGNSENVTIEGFLKMHGQVSVLGIVSVTLDVYLAFQFLHKGGPPERNIVTGRAKCTLKVEIAFFSISVSVDIQQSFGGDPNDPTFAQAISAGAWAEYAAAFAPVS
ncbi:MAG: hypothetical protein IT198_07195 [Acidimicrobiia bacterium]|nr:hypothetical protein [Acidimicrobiia bacterium]